MAAVKHAQSVDQSVSEVAKELGISGTTLRRWINEYDEYGLAILQLFLQSKASFTWLYLLISIHGKLPGGQWIPGCATHWFFRL